MIENKEITTKTRLEFIEKINSQKTQRELNLRTKIKTQEWFFSFSGKLPDNWLEVSLMDVTWLITCGVAKKPTYIEHGIPFLSAQNCRPFKTNLNKVKFISEKEFKKLTVGGKPKRNDILYTRVGNCGEAAKIKYEFDFAVYVSLTLIKPIHELIDSDYLVSFLNGYYGKQQSNVGAIGIGLKNLNVDNVRKYRVPLPPIPIQQAIVSKIEELFSEIDKGIENLRTAQQQLKTYRQAVLKWAFEGKLTNKNVRDGELPKGWKRVVLGDVCKNVEYGSATKSKEQGNIPVLRMGNIQNGKFDWDDLVFTDNEVEIEKYLLKKDDVLFNRTNSAEWVGKTAIYKAERPAIFAGYLIRINRKEDLLDANFITYYLNSLEAKKYGNSIRSFGVNQSNINGTKLKSYPICLPLLKEQKRIVQEIESRLSVADKMEESITQSLQQAEGLRQSILKKAFEGNLIN